MNRNFYYLAAVISASALSVGAPSQAFGQSVLIDGIGTRSQVWLADRRYTEGAGIQVGDFELHPGIGAEFGYDSNYFRRADEEDPIGALRVRIAPSFSISTLGPLRRSPDADKPWVAFRAGVYASYDEFFGVSGSDAGIEQMGVQRNIGGKLDAAIDFAPGRVVFGGLRAGIARYIEPSNAGVQASSFNRLVPEASAEIGFAPGGGLFDWRFGYGFTGTVFEAEDATQLNHLSHEISTRGRWRFLPRTALSFDGRFGFINYTSDVTGKTDSHPLRARIGFNGLITNSFAVLAMGGWGASFYTPSPQYDFDSFIGQAEVKWLITPSATTDPAAASLSLSSLAVGFTRDFADSYIGTYEEINRGYVKFSYMFASRFLLVVDGGVAAVVRPPIPSLNTDAFTTIRIDPSIFGEYRFTNWFGMNATVRYDTNITDQTVINGGESEALQWQQIQAYIGARLLW